jgi:ABC-type transporter Mla subunit MlaD
MAAIDALGGLLNTAKSKFSAGLGVVKALACLPAILTGAMGIFKDVFGALKNAAMGAIQGAVGAIAGMVEGMVQAAVGQVLGAVQGVLDQIKALVATIAAAINMIKDFFKSLVEEANAALSWAQNAENCRFAAAALLKCILAKVISDISSDLDISTNISSKLDSITNVTDKLTSKITGAGGVIEGFLNKAEEQLNRADATLKATTLI